MGILGKFNLKNNNTLDAERFLEYEKSVINSKRLTEVLNLIDRDGLKILDVGGASGLFLNEISKLTNYKVNLYNFEIDEFYKNKQAGSKINFLTGSIINNNLENEIFDIVTFGDVLHHLIGKNLRETHNNQQRAIQEMFRTTKNGGYIIFNEEVNKIKFFSMIIYYLSRLANKLKIKSSFFDAGKVVVSFLTPHEIAKIIEKANKNYKVRIIKKYCDYLSLLLRWRITLLMSSVGNMNYVIKKLSENENK